MEDIFKKIECNDDVLSFPNNTFKVGNFREEVRKEFSSYLTKYLNEEGLGYISIKGMAILSNNIIWQSFRYKCEFLQLNTKSWRTGTLRIQVILNRTTIPVTIYSHGGRRAIGTTQEVTMQIQDILLEFCPDEPEIEQTPEITPSESPLDDIRRRISEASA